MFVYVVFLGICLDVCLGRMILVLPWVVSLHQEDSSHRQIFQALISIIFCQMAITCVLKCYLTRI
jgi:hypothetical protein